MHDVEDETDLLVRRMQAILENARKDEDIPVPSWDTEALQRDFEVVGFMAPFVVVRRRADGVRGSLLFRHSPRVYYSFEADK